MRVEDEATNVIVVETWKKLEGRKDKASQWGCFGGCFDKQPHGEVPLSNNHKEKKRELVELELRL